jgi:hypothetical protein
MPAQGQASGKERHSLRALYLTHATHQIGAPQCGTDYALPVLVRLRARLPNRNAPKSPPLLIPRVFSGLWFASCIFLLHCRKPQALLTFRHGRDGSRLAQNKVRGVKFGYSK